MKIKKIEWEERKVNKYYTDKKYTSNKLKIGVSKLNFVIEHNVYNDDYKEYVLHCFINESEDAFGKAYNTLEKAKKGAEEYYINTMIELIQSISKNANHFEDTEQDVINVLVNSLKNASFE